MQVCVCVATTCIGWVLEQVGSIKGCDPLTPQQHPISGQTVLLGKVLSNPSTVNVSIW